MNVRAIELIRRDIREAVAGQAGLLSALKGDTLLITGGTGFMGKWLAELIAFLNDEHGFGVSLVLQARNTDRFRAACPHLAGRSDVRLIKGDVRHTIEIPQETNWLIHAAATPDSRFHSTNPLETMGVIAEGTSAVLRTLDRCANFKVLLNISSGLVYGPQPLALERIPEDFVGAPACSSVSSAYAEAKRYAETLCSSHRSQARIPIVTARPFAFIGPYQSLDTPWAINNFLRDALSGNAVRVLGDGRSIRSYLYPSDMAFWLLRMLVAGVPGQTYNVGSPDPSELEHVAQVVSSQFSPRPEIRLGSGVGEMHRRQSRLVPDVSKAHELGLRQTVGLQQAIERTIQWHRALAQ
jgi:dTDP-glucose 4,6-dehydratase